MYNNPTSNSQAPTATPVISQVLSPEDKPLSISWTKGASYQIEASEGLMMKFPDITFEGNISIDEPITINWGDGTEAIRSLTQGQRTLTDVNHRYDQNGDYSGYIRAIDVQGEQTTMQFVAQVLNAAPQVINVIAPNVYLDTEAVFGIQIEDTGLLDSHVIIIEWGDGSGAKTYEMKPGETTIELRHTFAFDTGGKPYVGTIVVEDKDGGTAGSNFEIRLAESFLRPGHGADYLHHSTDDWSICIGSLKQTISAEHVTSTDNSIVIRVPGTGLHLLFDQLGTKCEGHFYFPLDHQDELSRTGLPASWSERSTVNPSMTLIAGTLLSKHQLIFALGNLGSEPWSRPAIYRIATDEWVYPEGAVTSYRLEKPTLTPLDDGTVLIVGGRICNPVTGCEVYESGDIYDHETNTFNSLRVNPMMSLLNERGILNPHINTVKLEDGRVLIVEGQSGGHLSVWDPASEEFYLVEPEEQFTQDVENSLASKQFICDVQPILLKGGEVFLGGSLLSADLKTMEYLDNNRCRLADGQDGQFLLGRSAQQKLEDDRILLVGYATPSARGEAWIFDGDSYGKTIYQPYFLRKNPYLVYDSQGNIVVFGGIRAADRSTSGKEMEVFVTAPSP